MSRGVVTCRAEDDLDKALDAMSPQERSQKDAQNREDAREAIRALLTLSAGWLHTATFRSTF
jgi:hypothetical protein